MSDQKDPLDTMLEEIFGGSAIQSPKVVRQQAEAEQEDESPDLPPGYVLVSDEEVSAAMERGPTGLLELMMEKTAEEAAKQGITIAQVRATPDGLVITKGDQAIELGAGETMVIHKLIGAMIDIKLREARSKAIRQIIEKLWGKGEEG